MRDRRGGVARAAAILVSIAILLSGCAGRATRKPKDRYEGMNAAQIFDLGMRQLENGKYAKSRDTLQAALAREGATQEMIPAIHLALADSYFRDGGLLNLAEALSRYTNFLTFYPNHDRADYAQFQLGLCYLEQAAKPDRDQEQTRKALLELGKVRQIYPDSEHAAAADREADKARELLAEHDFRIGRFYARRGDHAGAVGRLREVLEDYENFSRKPDVYLILGRSLLALDRQDEGRLYLRKLVAEFPDSRPAVEARALLGEEAQTAEGGR